MRSRSRLSIGFSWILLLQLAVGSTASSLEAPQSTRFKIKEWPRNLRTDLKGGSIVVVLPENALDHPWNNALIAKFHELTGISVRVIRPGNEVTAVLASYLRGFEIGKPEGDVYAIDIVWPGILADYAEDLRPHFGTLEGMLPSLVENNTVNGKLIAIPYFIEVSLLFYRRDLLQKYQFTGPPRTWAELEQQAKTIQNGERANGKTSFWGFLWQGAASEALTCNALEWQISNGAGRLVNADGTLSINPERLVRALERARDWIGSISPPTTIDQLEDDSLQIWQQGDAAFMRNWPYAYLEGERTDSKVKGLVAVTVLPIGTGPEARHADTLGGFQLMVSKTSKKKAAAIEFVKFLASPEIQRVNAMTRGYGPTRMFLYDDPAVLKSNPFFGSLRQVILEGAATRPSTAAGPQYDAVSKAYFGAVRQVLIGKAQPADAVADLERKIRAILNKSRRASDWNDNPDRVSFGDRESGPLLGRPPNQVNYLARKKGNC